MDRKMYWINRLFLVLFSVSVSFAVLPCGMINVHGLFGEVKTSIVLEEKDQQVINIKAAIYEKIQNVKGENIINVWFEILMVAVCISFCTNLVKLPRGDTIVTWKVRMDD